MSFPYDVIKCDMLITAPSNGWVQVSEKRHMKPVSTLPAPDSFVMLAATSFRSQTYLFSDDRLTTSTDFLIMPFNYTEETQFNLCGNELTEQCKWVKTTTTVIQGLPRMFFSPYFSSFFDHQHFRLGDFFFTCRNIRIFVFAVLKTSTYF